MEDMNKTIPPRGHGGYDDNDFNTFKNARERKKDGRFEVGDLIMKRYKVLAELGQGGMGVVYRCLDETAGIEVALKALPPELSHNTLEMEDIKDNFQLVAKLVHQNIAISKQLEKDDSNGNYYLIMECCEGEDLRRWIRRKRKEGELKLEDVLPIIKQVADALDYAHEQKIIHRDIKPGNIMISANGKIKVLDFGLAAQIHTSMTRVSMAYHGTSGTGPYMAPEQWEGRAQDARADQYALAVMTYEMLAGHLPFESADAAVLREAVLKSKVISLENIPKTADIAIQRAMSKEPAERFETCTDFALALSGKKIKSAKKVKKSNPFKWVALVIFLAIFGGGYYFLNQQVQKQQAEKARQAKIAAKQAEQKRLEAEKAEKARPAKSLAERKKKEADAKAERERLAKLAEQKRIAEEKRKKEFFIDENLKLQPQINNAKNLIESANYDRGQTFGKHLDELKNSFDSAMLALDKYPERANNFFKAAQKEILWIETNVPLRENAKNLQKQVADQQKKADEFNGSKLAFSTYKRASEKVNQSAKDYEDGNFTPAVSALTQALADYRKAYSEARSETIKNLLNSSKLAAKQGQWQQSFDHAGAVLKIDSGNAEAQKLQTEAENNLKPTLKIIATVDDKKVPASAVITCKESDAIVYQSFVRNISNYIFRDMPKYKKYTGKITYKSGKTEYTGDVKFTCNWTGRNILTVALKKVAFNGIIDLGNGVKLEMVKVEKGSFLREDGKKVTLTKDYWLGKFEVIQAQWKSIMKTSVREQRDKTKSEYPLKGEGNNFPIYYVSWREAMSFCEKMNRYAPPGWKFMLPTETQWEFAARGGNRSKGYKYSGSNELNDVGWYSDNSGSTSHEVGSKKVPNELGLYDMSGNTYEMCLDDWTSNSNDIKAEFIRAYNDSNKSRRVIRGGGWESGEWRCRSAYRFFNLPGVRHYDVGFRLALVPVQ